MSYPGILFLTWQEFGKVKNGDRLERAFQWFEKAGAEFASGTGVGTTALAAAGLVIEIDFIAYLGK